ncbi:hypothetical protein BDV96DRAFT_26150 [Lophiotrema nucula]|uniref:Uncharacterized protein n=1 Tax=Lophiotrema nucula TaxID=690887 RepID=A0A6A5ZET2_9PLEO|nr:hypothetical protein BDV96DRAFT_26150 [Lophiotrema nucula]
MDQVGRARTKAEEEGRPRQLPTYFIEAIQLQLGELRDVVPSNLHDNSTQVPPFELPTLSLITSVIAQLYLLSTENMVREAAVKQRTASSINTPDIARLDSLHELLNSIEQYKHVFYNMFTRDRIGFTMHIGAQQSHATITLFRLSTLQEPGWDTAYVRKRVNVLEYLDRAEKGFAELPALHGLVDDAENGESGMIFKAPAMLKAIKAKFAAEMGEEIVEEPWDERENGPLGGDVIAGVDEFATFFAEDPLFAELFFTSATF